MLLKSIAQMTSGPWLYVHLALLACGLVGCGSKVPEGSVEGSVTLDGKPVPDGTVVMFSEGPGPFTGIIGADGKFTVPVPVKVGSYLVAVQQPEKDDMDPKARKEAAAAGKLPAFQSVIPEKYRAAQSSGMKFDVKEGTGNKFEFDMKSK